MAPLSSQSNRPSVSQELPEILAWTQAIDSSVDVDQEQFAAPMQEEPSAELDQEMLLGQDVVQSERTPGSEKQEGVIMAREAAQAAEEEARQAIERVYAMMERLEEVGHSRHLVDELARLQEEADSAKQRALLVGRQVEQSASSTPVDDTSIVQPETGASAANSEESQQQEDMAHDPEASVYRQSLLLPEEEEQAASPHNDQQDIVQITSLLSREESFSTSFAGSGEHTPSEVLLPASMTRREVAPEGEAGIEEIEQEEESVAAVTALIIADAAAAAAAEAEAVAEASSARVREARLAVQEADKVLEQLRQDLERNGLRVDEASLHNAELQATRAHAALADAEAQEESARRIAMDAEAEAEVAEGMAFAADEQSERAEALGQYTPEQPYNRVELQESDFAEDQDDEEDTLKMPTVHPEDNAERKS